MGRSRGTQRYVWDLCGRATFVELCNAVIAAQFRSVMLIYCNNAMILAKLRFITINRQQVAGTRC